MFSQNSTIFQKKSLLSQVRACEFMNSVSWGREPLQYWLSLDNSLRNWEARFKIRPLTTSGTEPLPNTIYTVC